MIIHYRKTTKFGWPYAAENKGYATENKLFSVAFSYFQRHFSIENKKFLIFGGVFCRKK
jgi:hypothetical protein